MPLSFVPLSDQSPGFIAAMLSKCYESLLHDCPEHWQGEVAGWQEYDDEVFSQPDKAAGSLFLTLADNRLAGFASFDARLRPILGFIGHNCVLPSFRGKGIGQAQIQEILRRMQDLDIPKVRVTTNEHPFFIAAQRMYQACGFQELTRRPWEGHPGQRIIDYEHLF